MPYIPTCRRYFRVCRSNKAFRRTFRTYRASLLSSRQAIFRRAECGVWRAIQLIPSGRVSRAIAYASLRLCSLALCGLRIRKIVIDCFPSLTTGRNWILNCFPSLTTGRYWYWFKFLLFCVDYNLRAALPSLSRPVACRELSPTQVCGSAHSRFADFASGK